MNLRTAGKSAGVVQLFQAPLSTLAPAVERLKSLLSAEELARYRRYRNPARRLSLAAGRIALRCILAEVWGVPPAAVRLERAPSGKPGLADQFGSRPVTFSISHSPTQLVIALADDEPVGVDVEDADGRLSPHPLIRQSFSFAEQSAWDQLAVESRAERFWYGWTRKEASWKVLGDHQQVSWEDIRVSWEEGPLSRILVVRREAGVHVPESWSCFSWRPAPLTVAAVATGPERGTPRQYACHSIGLSPTGQLVWKGSGEVGAAPSAHIPCPLHGAAGELLSSTDRVAAGGRSDGDGGGGGGGRPGSSERGRTWLD